MTKLPGIANNPARTVSVLSVSPIADDHTSLYDILQDANWSLGKNCTWKLCPIHRLASAADALKQEDIPIIISECELLPGSYREMLEHISLLLDPPLLIVTSRLADEYLWAEALNLGAWDVMAKPFDATEVIRILSFAWRHWQDRHTMSITSEPNKGWAIGT